MEMKPDDLRKYQLKYPMPEPRHGRFSPDRRFYQGTKEEVAKLDAAGWKQNPFEHTEPYAPEEAKAVTSFALALQAGALAAPKVDPAEQLKSELAAAQARIAELEAKPKVGRPAKAAT